MKTYLLNARASAIQVHYTPFNLFEKKKKKNTHNTRQTQVVKFLERYSPLIVTGQFLAASLPLTNFRNVHVCTIF